MGSDLIRQLSDIDWDTEFRQAGAPGPYLFWSGTQPTVPDANLLLGRHECGDILGRRYSSRPRTRHDDAAAEEVVCCIGGV